jgi:hypothetical protein
VQQPGTPRPRTEGEIFGQQQPQQGPEVNRQLRDLLQRQKLEQDQVVQSQPRLWSPQGTLITDTILAFHTGRKCCGHLLGFYVVWCGFLVMLWWIILPPIFTVIELIQVDAELINSQVRLQHYAPVKCQYRALHGVKTQMTAII